METDSFGLLQQSVAILQKAAGYYVTANTKTALNARQSINKSPYDHEPFHATIYEHLLALQVSVESARKSIPSDAAETAVRRTLETFEALIRAKEPTKTYDTAQNEEYGGLQLLQSFYAADRTSKRRPKPLGYRKFLYCPPPEMRVRLKMDIESCCTALSDGVEDPGTTSVLSELETVREWQVPQGMLLHATRVRDVLLRRWECDCGEGHSDVRLAFTAAPKTLPTLGVDGCYRLYWPTGSTSSHQLHTHSLHLMRMQHEDSTARSQALKKAKRGVRFAGAPEEEIREEEHLRTFSTICEAVQWGGGECVLRANEEMVDSIALRSNRSTEPLLPMLSLRELFDTGTPRSRAAVPPKKRILMAVTLAYTYLHLSDTAWWPRSQTLPDFWYMNGPAQEGLKVGLPFLAFKIDGTAGSNRTTTEALINPCRPSLPAFGKLLLEIWKGAPIDWGADLEATVEECKEDWLGEYWLCAVKACLGEENILKEKQDLHKSPQMRSLFLLKVVKSLQWMFEKCVSRSFEQVFPATEVPIQRPNGPAPNGRRSTETSLGRSKPSSSVELNSLCLHDGSGKWELLDENNTEAARVWLNQLRREVHPLVERHFNPVRVAIIDTGVLFTRKTQFLYGGRVKEVRSFVHERDGERGSLCPDGEDQDGHGTHATSVLLDIDPFSDVYVAKVFHSRDQKQGKDLEQELQLGVARAITYAIHVWRVQVISLSFGFERQIDKIRTAILAAESANVIVLAAASNNGGNKPLSWPARQPTVFNIYATNGYGNSYERNPTQRRHDDNFAVLGSCVKGWWNNGEKVVRSGTSIATPVAAGLASLTIHYLRQHRASYLRRDAESEEDLDELCQRISTYAGMRRIFRRMVDSQTGDRDGYCYLEPWLLFDKDLSKETICENIIKELRQV